MSEDTEAEWKLEENREAKRLEEGLKPVETTLPKEELENKKLSPVPEFNEFGLVEGYVCPYCSSDRLRLSHTDDVGTRFFKCEKCGRISSKLKSEERKQLEKALAEHVDHGVIELENMTVQPFFGRLSRKVHPAIGVVDRVAYVGVRLPCLVLTKKEAREQELPFLVTSEREKILCNREFLRRMKWKLAYQVASFENRWSLESIEAFLNRTAKVDPADVYSMVKKAWKTYIESDKEIVYDFLTLWSIGTYFFHLFNAFPYVHIGGLKRTGKTKVLTVASLICFNAIFSNNLSTSAIFRLTQSGRCTLLMDETEKLANKDRASELRNLLLSGYKQGAKVYRTEKTGKDKLVPEAFEVYSPKMIANIEGIEDVLEDRCIGIIMKRGKNKQILNSEPAANDPLWQKIRDSLYLLYLGFFREVSELSEQVNLVVNDISERDRELWKPILVLAKFFDSYLTTKFTNSLSSLYSLILDFAKEKIKEKQIENLTETGEYIIVRALLKIVGGNGYYKVKHIKEAMASYFDEEQKWLSTRWIGRALRRLGFTEKRRLGTGYEYLLKRHEVEDLAQRLGIQHDGESPNQQIEQKEDGVAKVCWICRRPILESFEQWTFEPSTGKPCHAKCLHKVKEESKHDS